MIVLAGRWEVSDRLIDGKWMHIGEPAFDADLKQSLEQAVQVGDVDRGADGADDLPCFDSGEQDNGQPWPEDSPTRLADYNAMVRQVAAEHPATVQLDDFGSQLCPGGVYAPTIDGVQIRDGDGVHIVPTPAAGQWLDARILPEAIKVGPAADGRPAVGPAGVLDELVIALTVAGAARPTGGSLRGSVRLDRWLRRLRVTSPTAGGGMDEGGGRLVERGAVGHLALGGQGARPAWSRAPGCSRRWWSSGPATGHRDWRLGRRWAGRSAAGRRPAP